MAFSHHFSKNVIITSANGVISKVRISRFLSPNESMTYEGRFEILSLNGSMFVTENEYQNNLSAGLKVVLKSLSNGHVFGGRVVDVLITASPIQI
ncbi:hypothetical protein KIW84_050266 [Lathyrus oleraceus]|uniref:AT-hook motif nuclear-localized protein n=1 Tax=Pisum sativum TaxID=3888 RepID=A0A9D4WIQ8_PEA|nr:hypothetical protein KIW84_050266 [Pisum sativum]